MTLVATGKKTLLHLPLFTQPPDPNQVHTNLSLYWVFCSSASWVSFPLVQNLIPPLHGRPSIDVRFESYLRQELPLWRYLIRELIWFILLDSGHAFVWAAASESRTIFKKFDFCLISIPQMGFACKSTSFASLGLLLHFGLVQSVWLEY